MTVAGVRVAGRYRLGSAVGTGGMGRVWLSYDEVLRREVAVKQIVLPFGLADDERQELRQRTLREARAAARLSHPNIVRIYDVINSDEQPWIVMEYVHALSLLQMVSEHGPLPAPRVARIGLAMLSALAAANRAGVLHRDVKPGNVLIADDGRVVLTDFGSAVLDDTDGAITKTGLILGSPQYMAPERIQKGICTPESDLWSLGATLYTAAEGRSPFDRPTVGATLIAVATEQPDRLHRATALKPVLTGLLRKNPAARLTSTEAERRLRQVAVLEPQAPRAGPLSRKLRERVPLKADPAAAADNTPIVQVPPPPGTGGQAEPRTAVVVVPPAALRAPGSRWPRWAVAAVAATALLAPAGVAVATQLHRAPAASRSAAAPPAADVGTADLAGPNLAPPLGQPLPAGLTWWYDPSGFVVPVPVGWKALPEGPKAVLFTEPSGPGTLRARSWDRLAPDPVVAMTREEARANLRDYHRLRIEALPDDAATEWEYTFTGPAGAMHGIERGLVLGGHTYLIQWRVPEAAWPAGVADYTAIVDGFQPPRPASRSQL